MREGWGGPRQWPLFSTLPHRFSLFLAHAALVSFRTLLATVEAASVVSVPQPKVEARTFR